MDTAAYLSRIDYTGPLEPTAATLRALQRVHLLAVPFENLDIHLGRPLRLEPEALFDKIVTRRRGGFCYELNGLFARLLVELGFAVTLLNARGINDDGSYSIEFDHLALLVSAPQEEAVPGSPQEGWLVDVGWGNGPVAPLRVVTGVEQRQGERLFRLDEAGAYLALRERIFREDGGPDWTGHYAFTLQPRAYADFFECCIYHQTSPESIFTRKRMITRYLPDGRVTLAELRLIITRGGQRAEREISEGEEYRRVLREQFGVELDEIPRPPGNLQM